MKPIPVTAIMEIERDGKWIEIQLSGKFIPATPDVFYLPNGDPGYPGTDAEIDDLQARCASGQIDLTEAEEEAAIEKLMESAAEIERDHYEPEPDNVQEEF